MIRMLAFFCWFLLFQSAARAKRERHVIYWNTVMNPKLQWTSQHVYQVKIGEFLDILCPQQSLMGITDGHQQPQTFKLYNVTENDFERCSGGGNQNFIFACDQPERENKLTIKFQTISPSPLGFRFQYCSEYYFVAISHNDNGKGCTKTSTRLRLFVECREKHRHRHEKATTTSTTTLKATTTTIPSTTTTTTKKIVRPALRNTGKEQTTKSTEEQNLDPEKLRQTQDRGGENSATSVVNSFTAMILALCACAVTYLCTS
uniref:Ephrin RBD domain-containing protein n=1 Tax=Ciona savignyi TaxID=51511 RepID=H2Y9D6_CIOSA